jgi:uncharacterized 2Fe-2S/4Fe-4S cluster protein (DUF4445 family)
MNTNPTFYLEFQPIGKRVKVAWGANILKAARQAGIDLASACGGEGNCGQCQIVLLAGQATPITPDEEFILSELELAHGNRLACCTQAHSDLKIHIPKGSLITGQRLQIEADLPEIEVDPIVRAIPVELPVPTLHDIRSDLTRLADTLGLDDLQSSPGVIRSLPAILRENDWRVNVFLRDREIVGLGIGDERPLGYAVDLGTTKIAAYLVDLESGADLASGGIPNPQIGYGEDVIGRLNHVHRNPPEGGRVLAEKARQALNDLLGDLLQQAGAKRSQVVEACIVGNTAMLHLLLGLPVGQLVASPYVAAVSSALEIRAADLGLEMAPGAYAHIPPCIGGFVGADHVAMILASNLDQSDRITLGIDIGTNTEIAIRKPGMPFLISASCASGPAFEGAHIRDGMRAASGAIEKVRITPTGVELTTIDDKPAVGLCGSGIVDVIAELFQSGLINHRGRFQKDNPRVRLNESKPEFVLVPAKESGTEQDILIRQKDVDEIQLAKGAIQAGLNILLDTTGTAPEDVEEVLIAGAFGSFLNVKSAIAMGLFPHLPNAHYRQIGNAAVIGAKWMLISGAARARARKITRNTQYNELTTYPKFSRQFTLGMLFPGEAAQADIKKLRSE